MKSFQTAHKLIFKLWAFFLFRVQGTSMGHFYHSYHMDSLCCVPEVFSPWTSTWVYSRKSQLRWYWVLGFRQNLEISTMFWLRYTGQNIWDPRCCWLRQTCDLCCNSFVTILPPTPGPLALTSQRLMEQMLIASLCFTFQLGLPHHLTCSACPSAPFSLPVPFYPLLSWNATSVFLTTLNWVSNHPSSITLPQCLLPT